jgi:hypothetical protein
LLLEGSRGEWTQDSRTIQFSSKITHF